MQIESVIFQNSYRREGNKEAIAVVEGGQRIFVFAWFDDELTFKEEELVNLTVEEARDLKQNRDIAYLQS